MSHEYEIISYRRTRVYDPFLRVLHWGIALSIISLIGTILIQKLHLFEPGMQRATIWAVHVYTGYVFATSVALRVIWGIIGPKHARFSQMWHFRLWINALQTLIRERRLPQTTEANHFGHDPLASAIYLLMYIVFIGMGTSGLLLAGMAQDMGPFSASAPANFPLEHTIEELHEFGFNVILGFIFAHIAALIWHEKRDHLPLAQSMISGYQYRHNEDNQTK